ncbi:MAG: efflux RND transporter periplasmic adaptor subunit [Pseudomonadota bacterium]
MIDSSAAPKTNSFRRWMILIVVCVVVAAVLGGLKYMQIAKAIAFANSFPERSETVTSVIAEPIEWDQHYRTLGEVKATRYVELRTELAGKISEIGFVAGSPVTEGQLLIALDTSEERAELMATRAQLELAEVQLKRVAELRAKQLASENEYDSAVADRNILQANVAALEARIDKKSLFAPFDADTGLHTLEVGQYLPDNSIITELIGSNEEMWVDFNLPQGKTTLSIGDPVEITSRSYDAGALTARVISADSSLNMQSRSRSYRALLANPPDAIRPGSVVDVDVITGTLEDIFLLPSSAVRRNNFGAYVYVLEEAEPGAIAQYRASRREVTVGPGDEEQIVVFSGVQSGEQIAATGAFKLTDGLLTHVAPASEAPLENAHDTGGDILLGSDG